MINSLFIILGAFNAWADMCAVVIAAHLVQPNVRWINGPIIIIELRYFGYFVALFNHENLNPLPNFSPDSNLSRETISEKFRIKPGN